MFTSSLKKTITRPPLSKDTYSEHNLSLEDNSPSIHLRSNYSRRYKTATICFIVVKKYIYSTSSKKENYSKEGTKKGEPPTYTRCMQRKLKAHY